MAEFFEYSCDSWDPETLKEFDKIVKKTEEARAVGHIYLGFPSFAEKKDVKKSK